MPGPRFPRTQSPEKFCARGAGGSRLLAAFLVHARPLPDWLCHAQSWLRHQWSKWMASGLPVIGNEFEWGNNSVYGWELFG